ncbi:unnamed protein product, partial [Polarella glacialis]
PESLEVGDLDELWAVVGEHLPEHFDEGHAVSCLARAAELGLRSAGGSDSPGGLQQLVEALREPLQTGRLQPSSLARLASAVADISLTDSGLIAELAVQTQSRATEFGALEAAVLARALANLGRPDALASLLDGVADRAPAIGSRALAGIVWAAASARLRDVAGGSGALDACIDEAAQRGDRLKPQALANLVWAMGALRKRREPALRALLPHVVDRSRDMAPQGLANSLWALAALRPKSRVGGSASAPPGWLEEDAVLRLSIQALRKIEDFNPLELAGLARATATYASAGTRGADFAPLSAAILGEATKSPQR